MGNLVVPLGMIAAGGTLVWAGIADPAEGVFGGLRVLMEGGTTTKRVATGESWSATDAAMSAAAGTATGPVGPVAPGLPGGVPATPGTPGTTTNYPSEADVKGKRPPKNASWSLSGTKPHVEKAAREMGILYAIGTIGGYRASATDPGGHPAGLALDFMVTGPRGDALALHALTHKTRLKVKYVIWRQRINSGDGRGWRGMSDRGSITANHHDHVHVSFNP